MLPLTKFVKLLVPKVKSEGTCKQGERSDLTGCTPASGEVGNPDKKPDDTSAEKPSGKSTLSKEVAAKVHSPEFKAWFGDWEKDPQNASKVINPETGEPKETHVIPRAVYHGRSRKFDAFKEGESPGVVGFFSESESYAAEYGEIVEPFFLNIRKPLNLSQMGNAEDRYSQTGKSVKRKVKDWFRIMQEQGVDTSKINLGDEIDEDDKVPYWGLLDSSAGNVSKSSNLIAELRRQGFDGIIGREGEDNALAYAAFAPTQIKGADNEGSFDPSNPNTRKSFPSVLVDCPGCGGNVLSFGDLLFCREPGCEWQSPTEGYVKSLNTETKALHKYASTQFNLEGTIADTILEMASRIPDEDLAKDGREFEPHVTIKYGLHTDYPDEVKLALVEWMKLRGKNCVNVRLKDTSLFPGDGFEVVKIDVESDDLHSLNEHISSFLECTDTHPEYVPHVTLAYVKSGLGEKYIEMYDVFGEEVVLRHFVFSDADGKRTMFDMATYSTDRSLFGIKGICQQGERSDLTGCTPANGEASQQSNQESSNTPTDLLNELGDLYEQPEVKSRFGRMTKIAKGVLANAIATIGDLAPDVIPNAYDHARNALLSTAVPGVPVNDIALALSKVVAWTWKKVKANANKALSVDKLEAIRDVTKILYAMLGLPDDTPLPTDEQIEESLKAKENKMKDMSAYDTTRGGALIGMPMKRRKLLHPSIKSLGYLSDAQMKAKEQGADEKTIQKIADLAKTSEKIQQIIGNGSVGVRPPKEEKPNEKPKSKLQPPKMKSHVGYQSKKLSHDADIALQVIKRACGQYNLAPLVAVRRALAVAGFSSRGQQDSLIQELRRAMRVSATGFEGRHGISKEEQDAAIVEGNNRLGFLAMR